VRCLIGETDRQSGIPSAHVVSYRMDKALDKALDRIRSWPPDRQEDLVRMLDEIELSGVGVYDMSDEEERLVRVGLDQAQRGEFVSDSDMEVFWRRNRLP
jgi:hypothetical protein